MSLLSEIQNDLTRSEKPLSDILRKAKILAVRLKSTELEAWVDSELNGYGDPTGLPPYRMLQTAVKGDFFGPFGTGWRNYHIPSIALPEEYRARAETRKETMGVAAIDSTLADHREGNIQYSWDSNIVHYLQQKLIPGMNLLAMWSEVSRQGYVSILDSVRNRLLGFVLDIEKENPQAGEGGQGEVPIPPERVEQIFNTNFYSPIGNVAVGSQNFEQNTGSVTIGDFESLRRGLAEVGVQEPDIEDLQAALEKDAEVKESFGTHVSEWMGRMVAKAFAGSWQISAAAAGQVLGALVGQYLGIAQVPR